jgi:hypothetical protein
MPSPKRKDDLLNKEEYNSLRSEIMQLSDRQLSMVNFILSVSAGLIGYGISNGNGFILLIPLILLTFLLNQQVVTRRAIARISSYISAVIEKGNGWETQVNELQKMPAGKARLKDSESTQIQFAQLPIFVGFVCILLSLFYVERYFLLIPVALSFVWYIFSRSRLKQLRTSQLYQLWKSSKGTWLA